MRTICRCHPWRVQIIPARVCAGHPSPNRPHVAMVIPDHNLYAKVPCDRNCATERRVSPVLAGWGPCICNTNRPLCFIPVSRSVRCSPPWPWFYCWLAASCPRERHQRTTNRLPCRPHREAGAVSPSGFPPGSGLAVAGRGRTAAPAAAGGCRSGRPRSRYRTDCFDNTRHSAHIRDYGHTPAQSTVHDDLDPRVLAYPDP